MTHDDDLAGQPLVFRFRPRMIEFTFDFQFAVGLIQMTVWPGVHHIQSKVELINHPAGISSLGDTLSDYDNDPPLAGDPKLRDSGVQRVL